MNNNQELMEAIQAEVNKLEQVEGELVLVKTIPPGLIAIKFKSGNAYWVNINKQSQVTLD